MKRKKLSIVIETYLPENMAQIKINKKVVIMGNMWDFHAGCRGSIIDGEELGQYWQGPFGLGNALYHAKINKGFDATLYHICRKTRIKC